MTTPTRLTLLLSISAISIYTLIQTIRTRRKDQSHFLSTPSPLTTLLPKLPPAQIARLAYHPDSLPGGRTVSSPWGSIRVYEFGPEDGQKVLFVHGISTPCFSCGDLARNLVDRGCRVMLFDLWGRGFSDNPTRHQHTEHLYVSQILTVLASSKLCWTHDKAFCIIGYSLGGGIATAFTSWYPSKVASLVLIAPSGLVRSKHIAWQSVLLYRTEGILPEWLVQYLVRRRFHNPRAHGPNGEEEFDAEAVVAAEVGAERGSLIDRTIDSAVQWQLDHHEGFLDAFISAIRHAPIMNQHDKFRRIREGLDKQLETKNPYEPFGLIGNKVILVLGETDSIIIKDEIQHDLTAVVGEDHLHNIVIEAGHDVPFAKPVEVADALWDFWTAHSS